MHRITAFCIVTSGLFVTLAARPILAEPVKPVANLVGPWQLFVDDHVIASSKNVERQYHAFSKHSASPLIVVDRP